MKKVLAIALVLALCAPACALAFDDSFNLDNLYPLTGVVFYLDYYEDLVFFLDGAGNEWYFEGVEDWTVGDLVSCLMFDNFTDSIRDDIIFKTYYGGNIGAEGIRRWMGK